ncbi:hypothetical protein [Pseudomonas matsuisoli]|nr:hypothetical protein [Pseudomonas matsuisoli]
MKALLFSSASAEVVSIDHIHDLDAHPIDVDALIEEDLCAWLVETGCTVRKLGASHWSVTRPDGSEVSISGLDRLSLYTANAQQLHQVGGH